MEKLNTDLEDEVENPRKLKGLQFEDKNCIK